MGMFRKKIMLIAVITVLGNSSPEATQPPEHLSLACAICHNLHPDEDLAVDQTCLSCHAPRLAEHDAVAGVFHAADDRACSRCHGYHSTEVLHASGNTFLRPYGDPQILRHCKTCHRDDSVLDDVSPGHRVAAAQQFHVDGPELSLNDLSSVCLNCHDEQSGNPDTPATTPAFPVHASHPVGLAIPDMSPWQQSGFRTDISPILELDDQNLECVTCHRLGSRTVFSLVPFATVTDLCNGCHDMAPGQTAPVSPVRPKISARPNQPGISALLASSTN